MTPGEVEALPLPTASGVIRPRHVRPVSDLRGFPAAAVTRLAHFPLTDRARGGYPGRCSQPGRTCVVIVVAFLLLPLLGLLLYGMDRVEDRFYRQALRAASMPGRPPSAVDSRPPPAHRSPRARPPTARTADPGGFYRRHPQLQLSCIVVEPVRDVPCNEVRRTARRSLTFLSMDVFVGGGFLTRRALQHGGQRDRYAQADDQ